jgi:hypothetical protein
MIGPVTAILACWAAYAGAGIRPESQLVHHRVNVIQSQELNDTREDEPITSCHVYLRKQYLIRELGIPGIFPVVPGNS